MFSGEFRAQRADALHDDNLELVGDLGHEAGDLLHQAVHRALIASLEQRGDGQRGNAAVHVGDQVLKVKVTGGDGGWVFDGHLGEGTESLKNKNIYFHGGHMLSHFANQHGTFF